MSFLVFSKAVSRFAHRTLFTVALAALVALASQSASQGAIVVSVEQLNGPAVADGTNPTNVTMRYTVDFTGAEANVGADGFEGSLQWSTSSTGVGVTDLITVNSSGTPTLNANILSYANSVYNGITVSSVVNNLGYTANDGINVSLLTNISGEGPRLTVGNTPAIIVDMYFQVAAGITDATFTFDVKNTADNSNNQLVPESGPGVGYTSTSGTLQVVPEPSTMYSLFAVGLVTTGLQFRRLRRRKAA
jgi:hypothetical protein